MPKAAEGVFWGFGSKGLGSGWKCFGAYLFIYIWYPYIYIGFYDQGLGFRVFEEF